MRSTDQIQAEFDQYQEALDGYSDELLDFIQDKHDKACLNWLVTYGMPETPAEVWQVFRSLYRMLPAVFVLEGFATFEPKALASAEDVANRKAERENRQQSLFDGDHYAGLLKSIQDMGKSESAGFGTYL